MTAQLFPPPKIFWGLRLSPSPRPSRSLFPPPNERDPTIGRPPAPPPPAMRMRPAFSDLNDLAVAREEGGGTGGAAGGGALDSAMVEKKEVRRGGRLLLLREVLRGWGIVVPGTL